MPIYTPEIKIDPVIREAELIPGNNTSINTTNFTFLRHTNSSPPGWSNLNGTMTGEQPGAGSDIYETPPNPYTMVYMYGHPPGGSLTGAILLNDPLMPGEKVTISGYFFNGKSPYSSVDPMTNTGEDDCYFAVYYEDDWTEFREFLDGPSDSELDDSSSYSTLRRMQGRGIVPGASGGNIGTETGWSYATSKSDEYYSPAPPNNSNSEMGMLNLSYFPDTASGLTRHFKITVRNDSSNRALIKLFNQRGSLGSTSKYMGIYDLRVTFENTNSERISDPIFKHGIDLSYMTKVRMDRGSNRIAASQSESSSQQYPLDDADELPIDLSSATGTVNETSAIKLDKRSFVYPNTHVLPFAFENNPGGVPDYNFALPIGNTYTDSSLGGGLNTTTTHTLGTKDAIFFKGKIKCISITFVQSTEYAESYFVDNYEPDKQFSYFYNYCRAIVWDTSGTVGTGTTGTYNSASVQVLTQWKAKAANSSTHVWTLDLTAYGDQFEFESAADGSFLGFQMYLRSYATDGTAVFIAGGEHCSGYLVIQGDI